jgi:hypothetical protein
MAHFATYEALAPHAADTTAKGGGMAKWCCAVLVMATVCLAGKALAAPPTLCAPEQSTIFSCGTGADTVSVCGSTDLSATSGSLQYRFARAKQAPWAYPVEGAEWRPLTHAGTWVFSGGGGAWLSFVNPPYRYVVYTAVGQGWSNKAGVVVERKGRRIANRRCKGAAISTLGPALIERAGVVDEGDAFSLP